MKDNAFVEKTLDFSKSIDIDLVKRIIVFDEVSSTNIKAKECGHNGEEEGTVVIARIQERGRGRFNRVWESPEGGLYLSVLLRPDVSSDKTTVLPLIASLAVLKTIEYFGLSSTIKWPNDVRTNGKKVAGILLESETKGNKLDFVILGIGINLNTDMNLLSKDLRTCSTSIFQESGLNIDYYDFLKSLLSKLDEYYKLFLQKRYDIILYEWKECSDTIGKRVSIHTSSQIVTGIATDIDQSGFLVVVTDSGEYKKVTSGDCIYHENIS